MAGKLSIKTGSFNSDCYEDCLALRYRVLREPLGLRRTDGFDAEIERKAMHLAAYWDAQLIGCVVLQPQDSSYKLRQMAVEEVWQGQGIGRQLVLACIKHAGEIGVAEIYCHARLYAKGFYEKLGFIEEGNLFSEVSIPHVKMVLKPIAIPRVGTHNDGLLMRGVL